MKKFIPALPAVALLLAAVSILAAAPAGAQNMPIPSVSLNIGEGSGEPGRVAESPKSVTAIRSGRKPSSAPQR